MAKLNELLRIGVFYDGHYFFNVSTYYGFWHERKARISIDGLHKFIRKEISDAANVDVRMCQIVDAHYFRGRLPVQAHTDQRKLYNERVFDDILISANVVSHYLPLRADMNTGRYAEKGIDVWLALEAYELAMYKKFDVLVLVACDGDYVPLVRKLNTLGTQVMLLSWDFEYDDDDGKRRTTRTSQQLIDEVTYPISMHEVIDSRTNKSNLYVRDLFVPTNNQSTRRVASVPTQRQFDSNPTHTPTPTLTPTLTPEPTATPGYTTTTTYSKTDNVSTILTIIDRGEYWFGFIKGSSSDTNIYFTESALSGCSIEDLEEGTKVSYDYYVTEDSRPGASKYRATKVVLVQES